MNTSRTRRPPTPRRMTYSKVDWEAAQVAWAEGQFSDEWKPWRHKAAMLGGIISPPEGTKWDSWEDAQPSQRAMLIRAIRETPQLLESCLPGAGWWSVVIERMLAVRDDWREEAALHEQEVRRWRAENEPRAREAMMSVGQVFARIAESMGYVAQGKG
jgi:hypothetical protein